MEVWHVVLEVWREGVRMKGAGRNSVRREGVIVVNPKILFHLLKAFHKLSILPQQLFSRKMLLFLIG